MPFWLTNAPATFQGLMNTIFQDMIRKFILIFVYDILIYNKSLEDHVAHLKAVLLRLQQHQLFIKFSKCSFAQQQLEYLGHIIGANGVATDPEKVKAVQDWHVPKTLQQLRGFLGLAGYYRKFNQHYGVITKPLTELLKKDSKFSWTYTAQHFFDTIKQKVTEAPVLALPDFSQEFVDETDASGAGIGAVLMQNGHPLAFISKALSSKSQAMSTYEKECMAVLLAVDKWRQYLQHAPFVIFTDHKRLIQLSEQKLATSMQHKAFIKLMGLQYKIRYKKGEDNRAADALSRKEDTEYLQAISACQPKWLEVVLSSYHEDPATQHLLQKLSLQPQGIDNFTLVDGVIRFKGRVWLGTHTKAKQAILLSMHNSGIGGHSGVNATYHRIKSLVAWPGLKKDVLSFVQTCSICQQAKVEHCKTPGMLQPLPVPLQAWHTISMDFVEG